ncbi:MULTISPECIES: ATP-grasp domain-containing protein [Bacillus]|uniref:ATP-grasp domain-containing protein n=2 Tax=Bacillaceae TaxID=186817 RepID=UPI00228232F0|nr:ATP-grasp domain-containing protein [Bacillus safensis]MCY7569471.1 ATP-grasp domain-containing protein [Bacillus safensis]
MKKLLILDWSYNWRFYITNALEQLDCKVYLVLEENRRTPESVVDKLIIKDLYLEPLKHKREITSFIEEKGIDYIFTTEDELVELAATIAKEKGFITCPPEIVSLCMNKWEVRKKLEDNKMPMPFYTKVSSFNDLKKITEQNTYPLVIKPIDGNFSNGAVKIDDNTSIKEAWDFAYKGTLNSPSGSRELILEEYVSDDNKLISCEAIIVNDRIDIIGLTEERQIKIRGKHIQKFIYDLLVVPAQIDENIQLKICDETKEIINILGLKNCVVHVEFKIKDGEPRFIELNPRMAGGFVPELYRLAFGIDLAKIALKIAFGEKIYEQELKKKHSKVSCVKFILPNADGVIENITYDKSVLLKNNIDKFNLVLNKGDKFVFGELFGVGYVITTGYNTDIAVQQAVKVSNNIKVVMESD